jgi:hypothetical protein
MWGENPSHQLQLTTSNLLAFQSAMPLQKLSNIYAEAIRITRYLGFNYIWIDSLCIIQDSLPDWTAEASTMSMVYNNAICTIAFLFPRDVGFIQSRGDPRALTPCTICEPSNATKRSQVMLFDEYRAPDSDAKPRLFNRAWAFQEHILSPRTILYGDHTIKWECVEKQCDELTGDWDPKAGPGMCMVRYKNQFSSPHTSQSWPTLVNEYRGRRLTVPGDRVLALSGVALAFQAEHSLVYLAGMWKQHFPRSLLWNMTFARPNGKLRPLLTREPPLKSVPTWSWFASPMYLEYQLSWYGSYPLRVKALYLARFIHFRWPNQPINHAPPTAHHNFEGLQIALELAIYTTTILLGDATDNTHEPRLHCDSLRVQLASLLGFSKRSMRAIYYCDDPEEFDHPPATVCLGLIHEEHRQGFFKFEGLALAAGKEKGTWGRVGYWSGYDRENHPEWSKWSERTESNTSMTCESGSTSGFSEQRSEPLTEDITSNSSAIQWGKESLFLRLEGAKTEVITLI